MEAYSRIVAVSDVLEIPASTRPRFLVRSVQLLISSSRERNRLCSPVPHESQIECGEHQDDSNVRDQSFQRAASKEPHIDSYYDRYHRSDVKHGSHTVHLRASSEEPEPNIGHMYRTAELSCAGAAATCQSAATSEERGKQTLPFEHGRKPIH